MSEPISEKESETLSRCIKIDDWIFEIKMVRAIRVEEYGQPYTAIANINLNGDNAYVDGLMTNSDVDLAREDFNTIKEYFQRLGVKQVQFDRYKNQQSTAHSHDVSSTEAKPQPLQLVSVG
ncbi:hypothetical protein ESZ36_06660 [Colwellia demingiae]|uniref:Uncharacterized protein n=1 Tax=Colwellia demingiae TaxID=89401 RepID=A0A5C6QLB0_9GAMM|nr:hypothetical protein [Colwellia demingiae]TWX69631.1 hypothetical protein ESZ36_06660 [Colwellia demingiae]